MDPVQGAHFQARSLRLALAAGEPSRVSRGIAGEAAYAAAQGNGQRAQKLLAEAAAIAAELDHPHASGIVSLMSGLAAHLGRPVRRRARSPGHGRADLPRALRGRRLGAERRPALHPRCFYYLGALDRFRTEAAEGLKEAHDRGSVYAATTLRIGLANAVWLLGDDPARAQHETREAMAAWSAQGYHVQHWYELIAETQINLYEGDGEGAYQRFVAGWPRSGARCCCRCSTPGSWPSTCGAARPWRGGSPPPDRANAPLGSAGPRSAPRARGRLGRRDGRPALRRHRAGRGKGRESADLAAARDRRDRRPRAGSLQGRRADGGRPSGRCPDIAAAGEAWMHDNGAKAPPLPRPHAGPRRAPA